MTSNKLPLVKIGKLCNFSNGHGFTPKDWKPSGLPIIRIQNLNGSREFNYYQGKPNEDWIVNHGDLLFAWAGVKGVSFGPTIWNGPVGVLNQHIYRIHPLKGVNKKWLFYALKHVTLDIEKKAHGFKTSLVHVRKSDITGAYVAQLLPAEQANIAELLSTWDEVIEKTELLITTKEKQLCAFYQICFQPGTSMNHSWKSTKLSEYLGSRNEKSLPREDMPLYSLTIENGVTAKTDRYNRDFLVKDTNSKTYKVVYPGDIVFNPANLRWGAIARSKVEHKVVISPIYEVLEIKKGDVDPELLIHALTCPRQIGIFATKTEGTLIERMAVKLDSFLLTEILLPRTIEEQRKIAIRLNSAKKEILLLKKQAHAYRRQKRGLMQKLLTGTWRLKTLYERGTT